VSDRAALLRAIVEHPDEDTPRLVFADWLDEHADALPAPAAARQWAAFVRADVAMAGRDEYDPERLRWELIEKPRREAEAWVTDALPPLPMGSAFIRGPLFRRGFPCAVVLTSYDRERLPELPAGSFPLERVRYNGDALPALEQLRSASWRAGLRSVELQQGLVPPGQFRRFFALDGFDRLERLVFSRDAIGAPELRELIASPLFRRLTTLGVIRTHTGVALSAALAEARGSGLSELQLFGCRVTAPALAALLDSPAARALNALGVGGDRIGAPGKLHALARATRLPLLRALDVGDDAANESGLETFLSSPFVPVLERLNLSRCNLNTERARLLASGRFTALRVLGLQGNAVGNAGATALARSPHFAGLLVLNLGYCMVGDDGLRAILDSPLVDDLVLLDLTGSPASAEMKSALQARMGDRVRL
jgi:uncharacterized protein (TIGR02996 family)